MAKLRDIKVTGISFVPAPKCKGCNKPMCYATATQWRCKAAGCSEEGKVVDGAGVYPFRVVE